MALVGQACSWLGRLSLSGRWRLLKRLGIVLKRARDHVHSPDPDYGAKRAALATHVAAAQARPGQVVTLYLDEATLHRQPTLASAYAARGTDQARAERSLQGERLTRLLATVDGVDGRVVWWRRGAVTVPTLVGFYRAVVAAYPAAQRLYVVQDNWPVHFHPDLLAALEPQESPFPFPRPGHWPTEPSAAAIRKWGHLQLPIQVVPLPTYAPWLNPIEKLWRWLRQELGHLHPWADDLPALRAAVEQFLERFAHGSDDLLRYLGLPVPK